MQLTILQEHNPILRLISEEITNFDDEIKQLSTNMIETITYTTGIGLSAIQVGVPKRMFIIKSNAHGLMTICNPKIVTSVSRIKWDEGCLSIPNKTIKKVRRNVTHLEYQNLQGQVKNIVFLGIDSVCALHEIDHLNGILITDK